ncbi:protein RRP5 homolog [Coccinella septempunctata]|uniref:protein RRP5 homolog n=1 Tax=Coccinella septempunctata TaxID=41139 RepID=UPI001D07A275|nr:protein RRP5 homolog [Coccinella septempunctata]
MDIFPRGGRKIHTIKRKAKNDTLFGNVPKKEKKEKVDKNTIQISEENQVTHIKMLSRQTILEGMSLLACIKKITENALEVELPGLITGKVMIDSISDTLVKTLKKALSNGSKITSVCDVLKTFFHCGQFVPLKIKTIQTKDENCVILGSISPKDVNSDRLHNSFKKGELIWATVISELDHGYQLECGVTNCRIFLPNQHLEEGAKLEIGQPIWCKVHRVDTDNAASILRVGTKRQHIDSILTDDTIPLSSILPGTKVEVYVEKVVKNGIHCKFLENYTGFIHESQLDPVMRNLNTIKESTVMCAYLLYVENISKIAHLSMRSLASIYELVFERGSKVSAEVIGRNEVGVYFKLNKKEKGWVSNKRILSTSRTNSNSDNFIKDKFPKGSKHQCVVLGYNHMDRVYICGIEKDLLKEKYFSSKDLKVGDLVEGTIQEIKKNGIILSVGRVKGFIPNIHLTDVLYSEYLKKKFVVGKKMQARVYSSNEKSVIFTSKPSFLKEDKFFHDLKTVQLNQIYPALVLKAKAHGLVLSFFNNIEGYVPFKEYNFQITQEYRDNPSAFFYSGQVIKARVIAVKTDKIVASLKLEGSSTIADEIGKTVKGIVTNKLDNGLTVFISKLNTEGFVPVEHLSIDSTLCRAMLDSIKENDKISDLMVIKANETGIVLSRREAIAYERCDFKVPKFQNIKKNTILRCSVESVEENGIFVSSPIKNFKKNIFVPNKYITREKTIPRFEIQQGVLARVIQIDRTNETIQLSLKRENVFDKNIQNSTSLFIEYLADEEYLRKYGSQNGWPINEYNLCERVLCTVMQSTDKGCLVELPNGCKGLVVPSLSMHVKKGEKVEGMVLGYNYQMDYVEICLNQTIMKMINSKQDGVIPESEPYFTVNKLLTREQYILAVTRKSANRQLVYLPLRLCENDSDTNLKKYYETDSFKVDICGRYGEKLIGFHRKLKFSLDYSFILKNTNWSELDSSLISDEISSVNEPMEGNELTCEDVVESNDYDDTMEKNDDESISEEDDDVEMEDLSDTNKDSGVYSNSLNGKSTNESEEESEADELNNEEAGNVENEKNKVRFVGEELRQYKEQDQINCPLSVLSSISNFFSTETKKINEAESSSDDEEEGEEENLSKKKLSGRKTKQNKLEQNKNVDTIMDPTQEVESSEQYEKLLMNNPNSSTLWLKYIAFCLSVQEFEKARSIGRRALASINMTCEDDKFNIWMTLLSIENLYGTKESFENVLEEAVKQNDAFKVYKRVTELLLKSGKHVELEEKIRKMKTKFKNEPSMWVHIAEIYYLMGNFKEARNIKNLCLKSITIKKEQYNLILKFAIMEFTHGEIETGILIMESVLLTYHNKIGAWLVYIDQLISKNLYKEARDVLNRAISLSLPLKSTKVIYHKYRTFEEKYGTPETLAAFKEKAKRILQEKIQVVS